MRRLVGAALLTVAGCSDEPMRPRAVVPVSRIGSATAVESTFRERCERLHVDSYPADEEHRQYHRESGIPLDAETIQWQCRDRVTGLDVKAQLYASLSSTEGPQVWALNVDQAPGATVHYRAAITAAREFLEPVLTPKQRSVMSEMADAFPDGADGRGFRIDTIGVKMYDLDRGTGVWVLAFSQPNANELSEDWDTVRRQRRP